MHSFGLQEDYAVLVEQPIGFDMTAMMEGKSMIAGMPVDYTKPTFFHIVPLDGASPVLTHQSPFTFTFNHVSNLVLSPDKQTLQLDVFECFRSGHLFGGGSFNVWLNKTRRDTEINFEAIRFGLALNSTAGAAKVTAVTIAGRRDDLTEPCTGSGCDLIRLPRINPNFQGPTRPTERESERERES